MKRVLMMAAILALSASSVSAATKCTDPKTHKFIKCPPPAASSAAPASSSSHAPHCTTGVPCGHSCIAKGKVCHKT
ncbi:MAG TPA: hypothetical protein VN805_17865 [Caulobacteraceae bacterium]|nr:hypothetical protein [Caulobacteraceae bacterium]